MVRFASLYASMRCWTRTLLLTFFFGLVGSFFGEPWLRYYVPGMGGENNGAAAGATRPDGQGADDGGGAPTPSGGEVADKGDDDDIFDIGDVVDDVLPVDEDDDTLFTDAEEDDGEEEDADGTTPRRFRRIAVGGGKDGEDGPAPAKESAFRGELSASAWRNPKALEKRLASRIRSKLRKIDDESVRAFLEEPGNRLLTAQWELLHRADHAELAKLMRDNDARRDLEPLLNDLPWLAAFVYDTDLEKPEVALAMLAHFRRSDEKMDSDLAKAGPAAGLKRRVAGAVAAQFARNGWYGENDTALTAKELRELKEIGIVLPPQKGREKKDTYRLARERYLYFAESIDGELLHSSFEKLPTWLLQYVCGWKGNSPFGTASTMRWLRDNVSAPAEAYKGMAYQVPYRASNIYGDSIHGPYYYQPFDVLYPGNFAKETRDVGAVCGGLSHFGASSACANGIPAITMGEPGHCAYAVYVGGQWHPCNSISEQHHPHWKHWGEYGLWSALEMQTAMYQDGRRTRDAQMVATLASMLAGRKNPVNALKLYERAVGMQPLYQPVIGQYIATAADSLRRQPRKWLGVNQFVCEFVAPKHPQMCAKFLTENIYPAMLPCMRSDAQKMQAFSDFFNNLSENEKVEWDIEPLLNRQYGSLGRNASNRREFLQMVIRAGVKHPEFGPAVTWAVRTAMADSRHFREQVMATVTASSRDCKDRELVDAAVIRAGEELHMPELVHEYSKAYLEQGAGGMPDFGKVEGNLISDQGIVQLGKTHPDQRSIAHHMAALGGKGGSIRSDSGKHQPMTLVLPKAAAIGTVIIVPEGGAGSYHDWKLETSRDGKSWEVVAQLPNSSKRPFVRVDFKRCPRARYLRVDSGGDQGCGINFKAFLVYDNKKAR